ncbi:hypothetical protein BG011_001880 [Mortierella polycephala]|uniref:Uncharacterized protein n=1 Tax=Mortierella polycephala TaxID=41804 RepID=A0A9P6Q5M0_9FUNG|nr:hypothetical protein BG011_001880 [Mortierella polycephala]
MSTTSIPITKVITEKPSKALPQAHVIYSQPPELMRVMECTTEGRHIESLLLLADDARTSHMVQIITALPHLIPKSNVVRSMNVKLDQYDPNLFPPLRKQSPEYQKLNQQQAQYQMSRRPLPPCLQLKGRYYRIETHVTNVGRTSMKIQHRFLTVPASQVCRDFNNRAEDASYQQLHEDDEPERLFASAESTLVFIEWQEDENGRQFLRPTQGPLQDNLLVRPPTIPFLCKQGPERRPVLSARPENAFRVGLHLRPSDMDEFGHVTNSRYTSLVCDVLSLGMRLGYYANGSGPFKTAASLPTISPLGLLDPEPVKVMDGSESSIAVPAGSRFYKDANVLELFVGYESELKMKPNVFMWSWVERERTQDQLDVILFEICSEDSKGRERLISVCRAIIREDLGHDPKASL